MNSELPKAWLAMSLTVIFTFISLLIVAQTHRRDVVYLKNGSIIKGYVSEGIPNETIKIRTSDGSILVFKMEEVERIGKGEAERNEKVIPKPWGYFLMARLGPNVRLFELTWDFSASIINGIQVNQYISLGIGAEATKYVYDEYDNSSIMIYPIFFDARFYNPKHVVQPMFSMQFGYSITGNKKDGRDSRNEFEPSTGDGGFFYGINGGVRLQATKRTAILLEAGFSLQTLHDRTTYSWSETKGVLSLRGNVGVCWNFGPEKKWARFYRDQNK